MEDFEKLGVFYLGKEASKDDLVLLESKDLTTHAVCIGMTGSGKTGLGIALLEEAGIDKIPAIIIDPKGDMGDILLTFPDLSAEEFKPWVEEGQDPAAVAKAWRDGLAQWHEGPERIKKLRDSVEMVIYTPASRAGIPLSILSSFAAPSKELILDPTALRERILTTTSSLLGLVGIDADPIKSREHILLSAIIDNYWRAGKDLDLTQLIQLVQKPPFDKIGAMDLNTFYPSRERMTLSISLNNLLASPVFQAWMEGDPLDIQKMLYTSEGKPKLSVISIAHLADSERMFFVTLLLNEIISWMRRQPGTSSLRALLYMDEIFGYFPPTSSPPSKMPMLTLLKQARAYGLGIVLCTQNPVDLDYKGLANCGTWFIGKLQTERDKARVIEGLNGDIEKKLIEAAAKRKFVLRSIHIKDPILFDTRWTLSYLKGPLTLTQIESLTQHKFQPPEIKETQTGKKPLIPSGIAEVFIENRKPTYQAYVGGFAKLHFVDAKNKIDQWKEVYLYAPVNEQGSADWDKAISFTQDNVEIAAPDDDEKYAAVPAPLLDAKNYAGFSKTFASNLYQNQTFDVYQFPSLGLVSRPEETKEGFRTRVLIALKENRDQMTQKMKAKYESKFANINEKIRKAQDKLATQQQQAGIQKVDAFISIGSSMLGALLGKKVTKGTLSSATTSMRKIGKIGKESQDAEVAENNVTALKQQLEDLQTQLQTEIDQIPTPDDPAKVPIQTLEVRPRKSDITVEKVVLLWGPPSPQ